MDFDPVTDSIRSTLIDAKSFSVNSGQHNKLELCATRNDCSTNLTFSYTLIEPNCLCYNGGTCTIKGRCNCPAGYGGPRCEHLRGRLHIFIQRGENLLNVDMTNFAQDKSDPWVMSVVD